MWRSRRSTRRIKRRNSSNRQCPRTAGMMRSKKIMAVNGIIGKKIGMTQLFDDKGDVRPVTVLQAGPCVITQRKTAAKDGYEAVQIGLVEFVKQSRLPEPMKGHFGKHDLPPMRMLREVAVEVAAAAAPKAEGQEAAAE